MELITGSAALARRLEGADAQIAALAAAEVVSIAGGIAAFSGPASPLTHAVGIGMDGPVTGTELDRIERFFGERESPVTIDLCPFAHPTFVELLGAHGYRPVEFSQVLVRDLASVTPSADDRIQVVTPANLPVWSRTLAEGFLEHEPSEVELQIGADLFRMPGAVALLASIGGIAAAGAALTVNADGVATLFGDATVKAYRGRGLQMALILRRLTMAAERGAALATASTLPGTPSERNYQRCGFQVAYTKLSMQRS